MKIFLSARLLVAVFALLSVWGCKQQPVVDPPLSDAPYELTGIPLPKGDRILGIDVGMAEDDDFPKAVSLAQSAGMQTVALSINWNMMETEAGAYTDPNDTLATANGYPPANDRLALYFRSVDTNSKPVPASLKDTPYDDPQMAERYLNMLNWALPRLKEVKTIEFLSVGDEIDLMMGQNKDLYRQFEVFFNTVKPQIKAKWPNLKVGFSATLYGLTQNVPDELQRINQESDIVLVSYYPNTDTGIKEPSVVGPDYDALVKMYPGRILYIEQTGYPTSSVPNGSEAKQREFIRETFKAWDKHADQIKYVFFEQLTDYSRAAMDHWAEYYGTSDTTLLEFIRTLGLRTYPGAGEDKEGFRALKAEAKARGW